MPLERPNVVPLVGIAALVAGAVLPWISPNPFHDGPVFLVYLPGMRSGLELWGLVTLPLTVLAAFVLLWSGPRTTLTLTGVAIVSAALALTNLTTYGFTGMFVPGPGVYLTLTGGVLLLVAAGWSPISSVSCA